MPKFGVSIYSISRKIMSKEITPEEGLKWLAEQQAEVAELVPFGIDLIGEPDLIRRLSNTSKECNIPIENYSLNANFILDTNSEYDAEIHRVKAHIDAAAQLGVKTFRVDCTSFRRPLESNTIENFQREYSRYIETYETLCDYTEPMGLTILLENHGFHVNGSDRVRQIMVGVDRRNFGHQLDVGNYVCVDEIPEIAVKRMLEYAVTIHMKDFYVRPEDRNPGDATQFDCSGSWFRSLNSRYLRGSILAQGDLDIYGIIRRIKDSGFDGNIFVEYEGIEDCYYGTKVSLDNLKRIYDEVNTNGGRGYNPVL